MEQSDQALCKFRSRPDHNGGGCASFAAETSAQALTHPEHVETFRLTKCASKFLTVRDTDLGVEFEALNHTAFILAAILSATGLYGQRFTPQEAIAAARSNAKSGSSFTVLWEAVANADTRRIADQALEQAQARKIELLEDGLFANILRSGGFLIAETNPQTKEVIAQHLVLLEPGGAPRDLKTESASVVKLSDAVELVKDTAELVERLYSTPSTEDSFLARRFYGGSFPEGDQSLFAIPNSLRKLGANPNEVQEAAALYGGYLFWGWRYALSMPAFAASPVPALSAAGYKQEKLTAEFLRSNHMDPNFHLGLDNVQSEKQLKERIELLTRLDNFLEEALKNEGDPTVVRANLSLVTMPLGVEVNSSRDEGHYGSSTPSVLVFFWDRLATGGFVVKTITGGD